MRESILTTLVYMMMALPVYGVVRFALLWAKRRKVRWAREAALCLFSLCLVGLASQTLLPYSGFTLDWDRWFSQRIQYNLRPFQVFADSAWHVDMGDTDYFFVNFFGNIAMFLPVGFFPSLLSRRYSFSRAVLLGFCVSLAIELCQIPLQRGSDIDDLWLNTLGAAVGYGLFALLQRFWPRAVARCRAPEKKAGR